MNHKKQFFKFVIPSVVSMLVFNLYTMVDGIYVARFVGEHALSAVNISMPYVNFIFAFSILFSVGTSTVVAIFRGENNMKSANETFTRNTIFLTVCALIITLLALVFQNELALFLGASEVTLPYVHDYLGVLIWFTFFFIVSYSMEVLVKTDGFPKLATAAVTVGAVTNIVMDYVLVVHVGMGIRGAAIATGLSQVLTFTVFTIHFLGKRGTIHWCKTTMDLSVYKRIIPIGTADFITELSAGTIIFLFNHAILKHIGDNGVVTYTVITYIYNIVMMTFTGISQGMQPLVSFYRGRREENTCRLFLRYALYTTFAMSMLALAICLFMTPALVSIFIDASRAELFTYTVHAFRIYSLCYLVIGYNIVCSGYFAAVEKSGYSFAISLLRGFVLIAASIWIMGELFQGEGIWYATLVCESSTLVVSIWCMLRSQKKAQIHGEQALQQI
ncbi:multidrug transporter MatE [[Clostridium] innocuum]|uniref:Multidrug export protein MepA n=1 Tax=Clostridium innocuum TaxID=1522 RepID=A0A099I387_CLOIN|nr:MATE family efflux transporter [[Clostridium] innocuum]KGJ52041.1 multidrug transporter MatE [[Clostridium] innocuum]